MSQQMNGTTDVAEDSKMHTSSRSESKSEGGNDNQVNSSPDSEQAVTLADYEHLVAEGRKLIARVQSVAEKQQTWKAELEKFYINEEVERIRSAALSEIVHESELESIDNAEFREWFRESNSRSVLVTESSKTDSEMDGTDLTREGKWFYSPELTLLTPFAAVIPFPAQLSAHGSELIQESIDHLRLGLTYVQTISAKTNLWHVAQNYFTLFNNGNEMEKHDDKPLQRDIHNIKEEEERNKLPYTHTPCRSGSDVVKLTRECNVLGETLRHTPCLLINDVEPNASLCGRCLVIRNQCVAAEILLSPSQQTEIIHVPKETHNSNSNDDRQGLQLNTNFSKCECKCNDVVLENDKSNSDITSDVMCKCTDTTAMQNTFEQNLREVIGFALQAFITEKVQPHMMCRTYMILFIAHINKWDNINTTTRENELCADIEKNETTNNNGDSKQYDKVLYNSNKDNHEMSNCTNSKVSEHFITLQEQDIRFEILNIDRADTTAFTLFSVDELCTAAGYVLRRNDKIDRSNVIKKDVDEDDHDDDDDDDSVTNSNNAAAQLHASRAYLPPIIRLKRVNNLKTIRCKPQITNLENIPLFIDAEEAKHDTMSMCIRHAEKALAKRLEDNKREAENCNANVKVNEVPKLFESTTIDAKDEQKNNSAKIEQGQEDDLNDFRTKDPVACNTVDNIIAEDVDNVDNSNGHNGEERDNWWTRARRTALAMMVAVKMRMISPPNKYVERMARNDMKTQILY